MPCPDHKWYGDKVTAKGTISGKSSCLYQGCGSQDPATFDINTKQVVMFSLCSLLSVLVDTWAWVPGLCWDFSLSAPGGADGGGSQRGRRWWNVFVLMKNMVHSFDARASWGKEEQERGGTARSSRNSRMCCLASSWPENTGLGQRPCKIGTRSGMNSSWWWCSITEL